MYQGQDSGIDAFFPLCSFDRGVQFCTTAA
jgi:hypothetical protein